MQAYGKQRKGSVQSALRRSTEASGLAAEGQQGRRWTVARKESGHGVQGGKGVRGERSWGAHGRRAPQGWAPMARSDSGDSGDRASNGEEGGMEREEAGFSAARRDEVRAVSRPVLKGHGQARAGSGAEQRSRLCREGHGWMS